jgi:hypothetical protein
VGVGDQHAEMFSSRYFRALNVRIARLVVSYDAVLRDTPEAPEVDRWLAAAKEADVEPLVAFQHVRGCYVGKHGRIPRSWKCHLPTRTEFKRGFRAFKQKYPWVRHYSPWNEANHRSQPTAANPRRAAQYYNIVRTVCSRCTIVAADVLDEGRFVKWLEEFRRWAHGTPRIWGLHNYQDTNNFTTSGTRLMLKAVRGQIWLTETGGIVNSPARRFSPRRAAKATRFMFKLAHISPRIRRLYVYSWTGVSRRVRFDAGLMNRHGRPRRAYWVVKGFLKRARGSSGEPVSGSRVTAWKRPGWRLRLP